MPKPRLPDFDKLFRSLGGGPLAVHCRRGSNFQHDLIFVDSLIHDAKIDVSSIRIVDSMLLMTLTRDRWELSTGSGVLPSVNSRLIIGPTTQYHLCLRGDLLQGRTIREDRVFTIDHLRLGHEHWNVSDRSEVIVDAGLSGMSVRVEVADTFPDIRLTDEGDGT